MFYRGAFSVVKKCIHKQTKQEYAAKIINTRKLPSRGKDFELFGILGGEYSILTTGLI